MKKLILLVLTVLMMVGCDPRTDAEIEEAKRLNGFNIIVIDSCEYLKKREETQAHLGFGYFGHKGNCRFCEERDSIKLEKRKKELKELIEQVTKK